MSQSLRQLRRRLRGSRMPTEIQGKLKLQRQIGGGAAILFKGSGFYQTDYRSDSYKAGEKAAGDVGSSKGAGDSKGGDSGSKKSGDPKAD